MRRADEERSVIRKLRDSLDLSREKFSQLMKSRGYEFSAATIESYEKQVPSAALDAFAEIAREFKLPAIAEELRGESSASGELPVTAEERQFVSALLNLMRDRSKTTQHASDWGITQLSLKKYYMPAQAGPRKKVG